jgi:cathepsin B
MKRTLILILITINCICAERLLKVEDLELIKSKANWESYDIHQNPFKEFSIEQIKQLLGTELIWNEKNVNLLVDNDDHSKLNDLPKEFDSRKQWVDCNFPVRQQQHCGSCWAFSAASVLTDRFCIASKGQIKSILSPQDMVSCDEEDYGCKGGLLDRAWKYLENTGIVTDSCFPYVSGESQVAHCLHGACMDTSLKFIKYRAMKGSTSPLTCEAQIKEEIYQNGPVQTGFLVYEDFMHYKSGIYEFTHGTKLGGHAVKIIGWGEENGKQYWIAQNSWGPEWGENGFFRIKIGECLFDENAYVGKPNLNDFTSNNFLFRNNLY